MRTALTLLRHPYAIPAVSTLAVIDLVYRAFLRAFVRERVGHPHSVRFPGRT